MKYLYVLILLFLSFTVVNASSVSDNLMELVIQYEWNNGNQESAVYAYYGLYYAQNNDLAMSLYCAEQAYYLTSNPLTKSVIAVAYWLWYDEQKLLVPDIIVQ